MNQIISCDWGTSALRLRVVDTKKATVLTEIKSGDGILSSFNAWKESGSHDRLAFYRAILFAGIKKLEGDLHSNLRNVPIVISGMASSGIGMMELPYKQIPFALVKPGPHVEQISATAEFHHPVLLISGIKTTDDVMRGEETQLIGCFDEGNKGQQHFIFPGTHSKHITVENKMVTGFITYMTGEFFDLLCTKSVLAPSVKKGEEGLNNTSNRKMFEEGVNESGRSNLLHSSFLARTNDLFGKCTPQENYYYLSGLLIGSELQELIFKNKTAVTLVATGEIEALYTNAIQIMGTIEPQDFTIKDADLALVNGHVRIARQLL